MKKIVSFILGFTILFIVWGEFYHPINLLVNTDLTRHLKLGSIIISSGQVPLINLFSYTNATYPFVNSHWLSEVIFYFLTQIFGLNYLLLFMSLLVTFAFGFILNFSLNRTSPLITAFISCLMLIILFERTELRPEIFSFVLLAIFIVILFKNRESFTKWIFLLIPLEMLWINLHIYFVVGVFCIWLFVLEAFIQKTKNFNKLFLIALAVSGATLINPNGLSGALYPFFVLINYGYAIGENSNIFLLQTVSLQLTVVACELTILLLFIVLFLNRKRTRLIDWLLSFFFTALAVSAIRNIPLFVFGIFITLAINLNNYYKNKFQIKDTRYKRLIYLLPMTLLIFEGYFLLSQKELGAKVIDFNRPSVNFFIVSHLKGPIFNNFDNGNYLEAKLYPTEKVFVDARADAYPASFFKNIYIPALKDPSIFAKLDKKYTFNLIFFTHTDKSEESFLFLHQIVKNPQWKMIYLDDYSVIFIKDSPENKTIIKKYAMDENSAHITNFDSKNIDSLYKIALAFRKFGWIKQEIKMYPYILEINPNHCLSIKRLLFLFQGNISEEIQILQTRYTNNCQ